MGTSKAPPSHSKMERFLRDWRQDALNKVQYDAAIFIGDKLLAMTKDDKDAFWLAQVHFAAGNYTRAQALLTKQDLISSNPSCRYLAAHSMIKQNQFNEALALLGEHSPTHLFTNNAKRKTARGASGRPAPTLGKGSRGADRKAGGPSDNDLDSECSTRRYEAAMCYLRGLCYAKQNAFDRAKEAYKDALRIDVQCYEAFSQLVKNSLMSPDEEDTFMSSIDFSSLKPSSDNNNSDPSLEEEEVASYVKMLYTTQLSKYRNPSAFNTAIESLSTHYGLSNNADILLTRADLLHTQCRFKDALAITSSILEDDKYNFSVYPTHLSCLYELKQTNRLFLIAHELADTHPEEPSTWLAVAIYYFSTNKIAEARRYFSKASMMDANFGAAWIGFAHTFAAEGEHDQAVTAYSTAARLFTGTHLPQVFLGMQNHAMNNMSAAEEFLKTAYGLCRTDPLLLNEMGIVYYHQGRLEDSVRMFCACLKIASETDCESSAWLGARINLGHAYRRLRMYDQALEEFDTVLREGGKDAAVFCAKGVIYLDMGRADEAVVVLHQALGMNSQDAVATELLGKALEESAGGDIDLLVGVAGDMRIAAGGNGTESAASSFAAGDPFGAGGEDLGGDDEGNEEDFFGMEKFEMELEGRKAQARSRLVEGRNKKESTTRAAGTRTGTTARDKGKGVASSGVVAEQMIQQQSRSAARAVEETGVLGGRSLRNRRTAAAAAVGVDYGTPVQGHHGRGGNHPGGGGGGGHGPGMDMSDE
ncbi:anaphase-promoting complex subunit cut9 [Rhypophila decipiens]